MVDVALNATKCIVSPRVGCANYLFSNVKSLLMVKV